VGFIKKYLGENGMDRINRAALAQEDPQFANINRLENMIAEQAKQIEALTNGTKQDQQPEIPPEQAAEADSYFQHSAQEFAKGYESLKTQPDNQKLIDFYGEESIREDMTKLAIETYRYSGKQLTAEEAWGMLRAEFDSRLQKINGGGAAEQPTKPTGQPSSESTGSATLNANLQQSPARVEPPKELDFSPQADRRRMAEIAARHSGK
jgi:hypothetical protein